MTSSLWARVRGGGGGRRHRTCDVMMRAAQRREHALYLVYAERLCGCYRR